MNLFTTLALAPAPSLLFHCNKCDKPVESLEAHLQNNTLCIRVYCHGEELEIEYPGNVEKETPIYVFMKEVA